MIFSTIIKDHFLVYDAATLEGWEFHQKVEIFFLKICISKLIQIYSCSGTNRENAKREQKLENS